MKNNLTDKELLDSLREQLKDKTLSEEAKEGIRRAIEVLYEKHSDELKEWELKKKHLENIIDVIESVPEDKQTEFMGDIALMAAALVAQNKPNLSNTFLDLAKESRRLNNE